MSEPVERTTFRSVLAEPRFRALFVARTLSLAASSLRALALSVLVFELTRSPLLAAMTFGMSFLPQAVGATVLGALADRIPSRRLVVAGYLAEAAAGVILAVRGLPIVVSLLVITVVGLFAPLFSGASSRLVAEFLTGDAYVVGRSLHSMAQSGAQLAGLAVGAAAVTAVGPSAALLVSAGCHLVAAVIARFRLPAVPLRQGDAGGSTVRRSWNGTRELLADRPVRILMLAQWLPPSLVAGAESLLVPYSSTAGFPQSAPALLLAGVPIGMLAGEFVVVRRFTPARREQLVTAMIVVCGAPLLFFAADPPFAVAGSLLVVSGAGFAYGLGVQRRFLAVVPEARRGQAFGLLAAGLMTLQGLGPLVFGLLGEFVAVGLAIAVAGAATVVTGAVLVFTLPREPDPTPADPAVAPAPGTTAR